MTRSDVTIHLTLPYTSGWVWYKGLDFNFFFSPPPPPQYHQLISQKSLSHCSTLLQWIKRICLPNSICRSSDNSCNNINVSHFCLHLNCNWKMTAQLFGSKVHCLCKHLRAQPNLPTWNIFWKSSVWSQQAKNQLDWTSFKLQVEQISKEQVAEKASCEPDFSFTKNGNTLNKI